MSILKYLSNLIIEYEVSTGFIIITVVLCSGSMNLTRIVMAQENN